MSLLEDLGSIEKLPIESPAKNDRPLLKIYDFICPVCETEINKPQHIVVDEEKNRIFCKSCKKWFVLSLDVLDPE